MAPFEAGSFDKNKDRMPPPADMPDDVQAGEAPETLELGGKTYRVGDIFKPAENPGATARQLSIKEVQELPASSLVWMGTDKGMPGEDNTPDELHLAKVKNRTDAMHKTGGRFEYSFQAGSGGIGRTDGAGYTKLWEISLP